MAAAENQTVQVVADIGGTNARFACVRSGDRVTGSEDIQAVKKFACANYPHFEEAVRSYLAWGEAHGHLARVERICLAVAGPVGQDWIDLPNNHWAFSVRALEQSLGLPVTVINDFSAQILSIQALGADDLLWLGNARPVANASGVTAVVGAGTGLGVSALTSGGEILPSEGGHVSFAPVNAHQAAILGQLWQRYERVSVERLLSGMGLANLYWANACLEGAEKTLSAPEITAGARTGDALCKRTIEDFCAILGSVAGDAALMIGAYDGVYLSGGILPQMLDLVDTDLIRRSFDHKGRFSDLCAAIPLAIITAAEPGLIGCAQALRLSCATAPS